MNLIKAFPFVSICIPSYNRPEKLSELLKSIDFRNFEDIEIVICEDDSPKRKEIRNIVEEYKSGSKYKIIYIDNEKNLGYDKNLKELIKKSSGKWIVFMGDDDQFVSGALDKLFDFLKNHEDLGYVLRSHKKIDANGKIENFRYYGKTKFFNSGKDTFIDLFRKSVFISGFTIRRDLVLSYLIDDFDGTALFQIYLLGEVVLKYKSAYFDEVLTQEVLLTNYRDKELLYLADKKIYVPRPCNVENSLRFLSGYSKLMEFFDKKYNLNVTALIKKDMSKYFYPSLSIHRDKGLKVFFNYVAQVNKLGFNISIYYYIYIALLVIFGKNICDNGIRVLKNIIGKTPHL
ncbi:glycosyltransferase family 2 protein [Candidatus Wolfebacteria bacterium]|nr:glycosyltransferase family 2 protein [Candidatus Wolfebacteria bacterium]